MSISSTGGSSQTDLYNIMQQMQMQEALFNAMSQSSSQSSGSQDSAIAAALDALADADDADDSDDAYSTSAMDQGQGIGSTANLSPFAASSAQTQQEQQMGLISPQHFVA